MKKTPFWKKWWFITLVVLLWLGFVGAVLDLGEPASTGSQSSVAAEPAVVDVTVPDVVGLSGDEAKDALKAAGLTGFPSLKDEAGEKSVWDSSNWSVVEQKPAAGEVVKSDAEIVLVVHHDAADEELAKKEADGTINSQGLEQSMAVQACAEEWKSELGRDFPASKIKIHSLVGVLAQDLHRDEDRFFVKIDGDVDNVNINVECMVGGTQEFPQVELLAVY